MTPYTLLEKTRNASATKTTKFAVALLTVSRYLHPAL
jgi:hypothetical protein